MDITTDNSDYASSFLLKILGQNVYRYEILYKVRSKYCEITNSDLQKSIQEEGFEERFEELCEKLFEEISPTETNKKQLRCDIPKDSKNIDMLDELEKADLLALVKKMNENALNEYDESEKANFFTPEKEHEMIESIDEIRRELIKIIDLATHEIQRELTKIIESSTTEIRRELAKIIESLTPEMKRELTEITELLTPKDSK